MSIIGKRPGDLVPADRRLRCSMICSCVEDESGALNVRYGLNFKRLTETFRSLPDLSGNANRVRELMMSINRNRVSPLHIDDIIEDFLASEAY